MAEIFKLDTQEAQSLLAGSSCAFGVFDGVHAGHRYLLDQACKTAKEQGCSSVALTFDIDPDELFHAERLKKLQGNHERIKAIAGTGVDTVCVIPFTREFASAAPNDFLNNTFGAYTPAHLHIGVDFRFGAKALGTVEDLMLWGQQTGMHIHAHHLVSADGLPITATRIRLLLADADLSEANRLLGHPYTICDVVRKGRGEGTDFGFATANLEIAPNMRVLADGVYACRARIAGVLYRAAVSVGVSPLFEDRTSANIEVHILDFSGDLYDQQIEVQFLHRIRPMIHFDTTEELVATVLDNIEWVRNNISLDE